jgi:hypothetical protein
MSAEPTGRQAAFVWEHLSLMWKADIAAISLGRGLHGGDVSVT